jgi:hypothetical protein
MYAAVTSLMLFKVKYSRSLPGLLSSIGQYKIMEIGVPCRGEGLVGYRGKFAQGAITSNYSAG